jgi:rubrerythrin
VVYLRYTTTGGMLPTMEPIEALARSDPKESRRSASTAEAAAWLDNPDAPKPPDRLEQFLIQCETDAPLCRKCGNLMQRTGHCHGCPTCGESDGCA